MSSPTVDNRAGHILTQVVAVAIILVVAALPAEPQARFESAARGTPADSAAVIAAVERYHRALAEGDTAAALSLLANDAMVLESGEVEPGDEYRSHHLPADIQFARAVPSVRRPVRVVLRGDVAWAISTSRTRGEYRGRSIDSQGAELMVLTREGSGWMIRAIHWSSHATGPSR